MSSSVSGGEHDECMICLSSLLEGEPDEAAEEDDLYIEGSAPTPPEIGAVWPCGHCFHIKCWQKYKKDKCPICNQHAALFSKIFISAPPAPTRQCTPVASGGPLNNEERQELEHYRQIMLEEAGFGGSERMLLRDMERQAGSTANAAKMRHSMTMMMYNQSRDLRKAERALEASQEEHEMTKDVLRVAQTELEQANKELAELKPKTEQLEQQVKELETERREEQAIGSQSERDRKKIAALQEKLDRAKDKLALKNRQLARRNKELAAKKKLINTHKMETKEDQKAQRKTTLELERTKKELELLKELDSFTMEDSSSASLGLSLIWD